MLTRIFWIECEGPGRLAILSRPAADWMPDEVSAWRLAGVDTVVSLLEPDEVAELGLGTQPQSCRAEGVAFLSFPVSDRGVPESSSEALQLAERLAAEIRGGGTVGVRCRAGIGRSAVVAACVLAGLGVPTDAAFELIEAARGVAVPDTPEQREWVRMTARGPDQAGDPESPIELA